MGHLHWYNEKCIATGACLLYMYIVYCGDWLICSLHCIGWDPMLAVKDSSFRWDGPDIHKQLQRLYRLPVAFHLCCLDIDQTNFVLRH